MDSESEMHMTGMMDMTGSTMKMPMHMKNKHMMWMWFHTKTQDTILFDFWTANTAGEMVYSCAILFFAAIVFELIKWFRWKVEKSGAAELRSEPYFARLFSPSHIFQCLLFALQMVLGYMLMLAVMTFSIWVGIAISAGAAVGYLLFGNRPATAAPIASGDENCCG